MLHPECEECSSTVEKDPGLGPIDRPAQRREPNSSPRLRKRVALLAARRLPAALPNDGPHRVAVQG